MEKPPNHQQNDSRSRQAGNRRSLNFEVKMNLFPLHQKVHREGINQANAQGQSTPHAVCGGTIMV